MKDLDADEILLKQLQQMDKERRDKETKLKGQEKRVRHIIIFYNFYLFIYILSSLITWKELREWLRFRC